ncbi:ImmA/IrrE family metallo-endopeptidase [Megasphaera sp. ASD88]|uniref:ImmA/IrrE family metallo-endopeptidase n=1 Tax=Megasphaera sp. ASD88 TaxID=2027407 RepID=UPI000BABC05B|nr:ImmA/IrrE family metallo-endopeptidase [Megasphaera sp. ASD88]PAV38257.1 ImmA/IrrE family metallo-endopeptidase [Megasphaera sp. ASD88]
MDIKSTVQKLSKKYKTNDPFKLSSELDILIVYENLGSILGYFDAHFRMKTIHINENAPEELKGFICAHELGHAILHAKVNTPFLSAYTLYSIGKIERQANTFAVELLLHDSYIKDNPGCSIYDLANSRGIPVQFIKLKGM